MIVCAKHSQPLPIFNLYASFYIFLDSSMTINNKRITVTMPKFLIIFGIGSLLLSIYLATKFIKNLSGSDKIVWILAPTIIFCLLFGGLFLILLVKNHFIIFNDDEILISNLLGKQKKIKWKDISYLKINIYSGYVTIKGQENNKIRIHQDLTSNSMFIYNLEEKTKWTNQDLKLRI
jgi:hypothetical protein